MDNLSEEKRSPRIGSLRSWVVGATVICYVCMSECITNQVMDKSSFFFLDGWSNARCAHGSLLGEIWRSLFFETVA